MRRLLCETFIKKNIIKDSTILFAMHYVLTPDLSEVLTETRFVVDDIIHEKDDIKFSCIYDGTKKKIISYKNVFLVDGMTDERLASAYFLDNDGNDIIVLDDRGTYVDKEGIRKRPRGRPKNKYFHNELR